MEEAFSRGKQCVIVVIESNRQIIGMRIEELPMQRMALHERQKLQAALSAKNPHVWWRRLLTAERRS
jgi:hypothetical protein